MVINPQILMILENLMTNRFWYLKSPQREVELYESNIPSIYISNAPGALHSNLIYQVPTCTYLWSCGTCTAEGRAFDRMFEEHLVSTMEVWFLLAPTPNPTISPSHHPTIPPWNGEMREAKTLAQDPHLRYSAVGAGAGAAVMGAGGFCTATKLGFEAKRPWNHPTDIINLLCNCSFSCWVEFRSLEHFRLISGMPFIHLIPCTLSRAFVRWCSNRAHHGKYFGSCCRLGYQSWKKLRKMMLSVMMLIFLFLNFQHQIQ